MVLAWLLLAVGSNLARAEQIDSRPDLDENIARWIDRGKESTDYLWKQGQRLNTWGLEHVVCDSILVGYALMLKAFNDAPERFEVPKLDALHCPPAGVNLLRELGAHQFMYGDLDAARNWFSSALEIAKEPKTRASLMQSIGTCHYLDSELEHAVKWYERSTELGLDLLSSISIMNLASVSMALGNANEGLRWAMAAETRLLGELDEGLDAETFVRRRDLILLNTCLAHLELGDVELAMEVYDRMKLDDFLPAVSFEFYHLAVVLAFATDSPLPVERHAAVYGAHLMEDSLGAVERFGPTLLLVEPWKSSASEAGSPWGRLRDLPEDQLPELVDPGRMKATPGRGGTWGWPVSVGLLFLGFGGMVFARRRQPKSDEGTSALLSQLRQGMLTKDVELSRPAFLALMRSERLVPIAKTAPLTSKEAEVLLGIKTGERAKETAQRLDLSVKSIYMMRTEIKRKLELVEHESLEEWVNKQAPTR